MELLISVSMSMLGLIMMFTKCRLIWFYEDLMLFFLLEMWFCVVTMSKVFGVISTEIRNFYLTLVKWVFG